ncbi:serine hydroxymethyltransferase [Methylobacterium variabile]|jgi:glycine hydroxymethyltransferase|uniref:serine hydroxymethyltransferase n=1 Tax=Methylobacterium variabile TaxID=298794 RepID=UPI0009FAC63B|nr:serine hydroxymethyltransferase [Methylobacterium variabile]
MPTITQEAPHARSSKAWAQVFGAPLAEIGGDIDRLIQADRDRESRSINMIASGSYCPLAMRQAEGQHLVNKNASGWPGRRTMANCQEVDQIEQLAIDRAKSVFGSQAANVQALSSTLANVAVLRAIMKPGERLLSFDDRAGGHISHGTARHITSAEREVRSFGLTGDDRLDLEGARRLAKEFQPKVIVAGATSYPRAIDFRALREIADEVGALLFSDIAHVAGLVAVGLHDNPVPYSDVATTSTQKTLCGPRSGAFTFSRSEFAAAIDEAIYPGLQGPAPMQLIAARAIQLDLITKPYFASLMQAVVANGKALCEGLREAGYDLFTGGTDTHMVVVDLRDSDWEPATLVPAFGDHGITGNGIRVPRRAGDRNDAAYRFGSTAMTIRGMDEAGFRTLGRLFGRILGRGPNAGVDMGIAREIEMLALAHPVPSYVD